MWMTYSKEEIANIMGDIHSDTNVGEVEPVAQPNQRQGHYVMKNHLIGVLPRLLHTKNKYDRLLSPVRSLEQIVKLQVPGESLVGEVLVHAPRVEEPHRSALHDVQAERSHEDKVHDSVCLLHEASLLPTTGQAPVTCQWPQHLLHDELPGEGEEDDVKEDKCKVISPLGVLDRSAGSLGSYWIARKDELVHRVAFRRVEAVHEEKCADGCKREGPGVSKNKALDTVTQGRVSSSSLL